MGYLVARKEDCSRNGKVFFENAHSYFYNMVLSWASNCLVRYYISLISLHPTVSIYLQHISLSVHREQNIPRPYEILEPQKWKEHQSQNNHIEEAVHQSITFSSDSYMSVKYIILLCYVTILEFLKVTIILINIVFIRRLFY